MQKGSGRRGGRFGEGKRRRAEREEEIGGHCSSSDGISNIWKDLKCVVVVWSGPVCTY